MKNQIRFHVSFTLFLVVFLLELVYVAFETVVDSKEEVISYLSGDIIQSESPLPLFTSTEDTIVQPFSPIHPYLNAIKLKLAYEAPIEESAYWQLQLQILDDSDRIVVSKSYNIAEFGNYSYLNIPIQKLFNQSKNYRIVLRQTASHESTVPWSNSFILFSQTGHTPENDNCTYNNQPIKDQQLNMVYEYHIFDTALLSQVLAGAICLFIIYLLLHKMLSRSKHLSGITAISLLLCTPILVYILSELITGNLYNILLKRILPNLLIGYLLLLICTLVFNRLSYAAITYSVIILFIALIDYFVTLFRGRPFMLTDILNVRTALSILDSYQFKLTPSLFFSLVNFILLTLCYLRNLRYDWRNILPFHFCRILIRVSGLAIAFSLAIWGVIKEKPNHNNLYFILENHRNNGVLYSLYLDIDYLFVQPPSEYSIDAVQRISEHISQNTSSVLGSSPKNLIVIMNESLSDLSCIADPSTDAPLLPFIKSLKENTVKGWLYAPVFGGNTASSEYEVLTGNSNCFLTPGSIAYQFYINDHEPGLANTCKQLGFKSIALHPCTPYNWNRLLVYPKMQFSEFYDITNWGEPVLSNLRTYPCDSSVFKKLYALCEEKAPDEKLFLFLVTMQNHGGYSEAREPFPSDRVKLNYAKSYPEAENYLTLINESDKAFEELITHYSNIDEPTMIVMFGDHQAQVGNEFYEELLGEPLSSLSPERNLLRYKTPYIIWANYPLEPTEGIDMSANFFGSYILHLANLPMTKYDYFLLNLMETIPVICQGSVIDAQGKYYPLDALPAQYEELINNYQILQYNRIFDRLNYQADLYIPITE